MGIYIEKCENRFAHRKSLERGRERDNLDDLDNFGKGTGRTRPVGGREGMECKRKTGRISATKDAKQEGRKAGGESKEEIYKNSSNAASRT